MSPEYLLVEMSHGKIAERKNSREKDIKNLWEFLFFNGTVLGIR